MKVPLRKSVVDETIVEGPLAIVQYVLVHALGWSLASCACRLALYAQFEASPCRAAPQAPTAFDEAWLPAPGQDG